MNREQMDQAARKYSDESLARTNAYTDRTYERRRTLSMYDASQIEQAFADGAEWRINSVWHKPSAIAEPGKDCLVEHMDGDGNVCIRIDWRSEYEWIQACHYDKILRWAYVDDLLPDGKEDKV